MTVGALHLVHVDKKWLYGLVGALLMVCSLAAKAAAKIKKIEGQGDIWTSWMCFTTIVLSAISWWTYWAWRLVQWCTTPTSTSPSPPQEVAPAEAGTMPSTQGAPAGAGPAAGGPPRTVVSSYGCRQDVGCVGVYNGNWGGNRQGVLQRHVDRDIAEGAST